MRDDSRRYHRRRGLPSEVRGFGQTSGSSGATVAYPYGRRFPHQEARGIAGDFADPLGKSLGWGGGGGPLATWANQFQNFMPGVFGQAQQAGTEIASRAPGLFNQFQSQIANLLSNELPNFQRHANDSVSQAYSPIASQSLYQNALRQGLEGTREGAAGRGLLDAGGTQAREETMGRDLAAQYAQNQFQNQQTALGTASNIAQIGPQAAEMGFNALPQFAQMLQARYGIPMEAMGNLFQMLAGAQNPRMALLQQIAPQVAQTSRSSGWNFL